MTFDKQLEEFRKIIQPNNGGWMVVQPGFGYYADDSKEVVLRRATWAFLGDKVTDHHFHSRRKVNGRSVNVYVGWRAGVRVAFYYRNLKRIFVNLHETTDLLQN